MLSPSSPSPDSILGVGLDFSQQRSICDKLPFKGLLHYWWEQMCWLSLHTLVSLFQGLLSLSTASLIGLIAQQCLSPFSPLQPEFYQSTYKLSNGSTQWSNNLKFQFITILNMAHVGGRGARIWRVAKTNCSDKQIKQHRGKYKECTLETKLMCWDKFCLFEISTAWNYSNVIMFHRLKLVQGLFHNT